MSVKQNPSGTQPARDEGAGHGPARRRVPLGGGQIVRLQAALSDSFSLDDLRQLVRTALSGGDVSVKLESIVAVEGQTLREVCHDLVLWALRDERVGLHGLLAASVDKNPQAPSLIALQKEWADVEFVAPACPYPGMKEFSAGGHWPFYGREAEVAQAVDRLRRYPFLAVIGPSGSGKSSLLAAGIAPAMIASHHFAGKRWIVRTMRPRAAPLDALTAAVGETVAATLLESGESGPGERLTVMEAGEQLLLMVDQYEELFTVAEEEQGERFQRVLRKMIGAADCWVILSARADFYANLMASPLWEMIREHRLEIAPPRGDALRAAISLPARDVGVRLEEGLIERLLADAGNEPGVLPFVQETLVMLWAHASQLKIGLDVYIDLVGDRSGRSGLEVALAEHAEYVHRDVLASETERMTARRMLLRLVQFGEGRADTRRQQSVEELRKRTAGAMDGFDQVLAALTANRLLTLSDEARQVDLSHEALIAGWPRLAQWIRDRRTAELTRRRLEEKAGERLRLEDDAGGLLDPVEMAEAEAWVQGADAVDLGVSDDLALLVADSRRANDTTAMEKERAAERLRRRNQWLAVALVATLALAAVAVVFYLNARRAEETAVQSAVRAQAENLASLALLRMQRDHTYDDVSLLLAREAVSSTWNSPEHYVTVNADAALRAAVNGAPWRMTLPRPGEWHQRGVSSVAYSPTGDVIASGGYEGTVRLWRAETLVPLAVLEGHAGSVLSVAFSPDGRMLASGGADERVQLWDVQSEEAIRSLDAGSGNVISVAFSPDGRLIATGSADNAVRLWDVDSGYLLKVLEGHWDPVWSVAFSPDSRMLVSASYDTSIRVWDVSNGELLHLISEGHSYVTSSVAFSPEGNIFISGGYDHSIKLWDAQTGELLRTLESGFGNVQSVVISPDGDVFASGHYDDGISLWNAETGELLRTLGERGESVRSIAFSPDGSRLVSGSLDTTVRVWDVASGKQLLPEGKRNGDADMNSVAFSPMGNTLASGSADGMVQVWDAQTGVLMRTLQGHVGRAEAVAFSPQGSLLASGSLDTTIRIWNVQSGELLHTLEGHKGGVLAIAFSPHGNVLASASEDFSVRLWDVKTGEAVIVLEGHTYPVASVAFSPDGRLLASSGWDRTIRLWDANTGELLRSLTYGSDVLSVIFSPDGSLLASSGLDQMLNLWDVQTGELVRVLKNPSSRIDSIAFNPDGTVLVSGSTGGDNAVRLWDVNKGTLLATLKGHTGYVTMVAFSSDGHTVASSSEDNTVRLWNIRDVLEQPGIFTTELGYVSSVVFSMDSSTITANGWSEVSSWTVETGAQTLSRKLGRTGGGPLAFSPDGTKYVTRGSDDLLDHRVLVWDSKSGKQLRELVGHGGYIYDADFRLDGGVLATSSGDGSVRLWNIETGKIEQVFEKQPNPIQSVSFSPDGNTLATVSTGSRLTIRGAYIGRDVCLWDVSTGHMLRKVEALPNRPQLVEFSPDGRMIAIGGEGNTIEIWDAQLHSSLRTLNLSMNFITSMAFSPDSKFLASSSKEDNAVTIWDVGTGGKQRVLREHTNSVESVAFSPDGKWLGSGDAGGTVRLWPATIEGMLETSRERIQRPVHQLTLAERRELGLEQ